MIIFYIIAGSVTLLLVIYASFLLFKVNQKKQLQKQVAVAQSEKHDAQVNSIIESIISIAKAMKHEQCPTIEGCIRLKVLIDQLRLGDELTEQFKVFYVIYDKTAHIPTHQGWSDLKSKEKLIHTKLMMELEKEYSSDVSEGVDKVIRYFEYVE